MLAPQLAITIWSPENGSFSGAWLLALGAFFLHLPSSFLPLCPGLCSKLANLPNEPNFCSSIKSRLIGTSQPKSILSGQKTNQNHTKPNQKIGGWNMDVPSRRPSRFLFLFPS